ncbi:predicted protein [Naegleria gruberi]|uniref:Predicted protein n=1 Tax=Naegleria gruberi TaxID=5762 RepID=D2UXX6_NAEGR|nr:uncharacterized protein NAEGRDRAFT_61273 [Naegleria gruberi]EFC50703.1 predicted protein [Naegleria gruberi]|eukprot:XP_002683447.1 predicted protein [Naegleria gruberi strain NEG-M]
MRKRSSSSLKHPSINGNFDIRPPSGNPTIQVGNIFLDASNNDERVEMEYNRKSGQYNRNERNQLRSSFQNDEEKNKQTNDEKLNPIKIEKKGLFGLTISSPKGDNRRSTSKSPQLVIEEETFIKKTPLSPIRKKDVSFQPNNENSISFRKKPTEPFSELEISSLSKKNNHAKAPEPIKIPESNSSSVVLISKSPMNRSFKDQAWTTKNSYDNTVPIEIETLSNSGRFTLLKLEPRKTTNAVPTQKLERKESGDLKKTVTDLNSSNLMDKINLNSTLSHVPSNPLSRDSLRNLFSHTISLTNHLEGKISPSVNDTQINHSFIEASMNSVKWSKVIQKESKKTLEKPVGTKFGERYEFETMDSLMLNESPPPTNSGSLIAFPSKRKLCLFGGSTNCGSSSETWLFEVGLQKWMKVMIDPLHNHSIPEKRFGHCAGVFDSNTMCIFGGGDSDSRTLYNDLWIFKPDPFPIWKCLSKSNSNGVKGQPTPRMHSVCAVKDDLLFIHGGEGSNFLALDDLYVFSRSQNFWIPLIPVLPKPSPRFLHTASVIDSKIIIIGGMNGANEIEDSVWSLDTRSFFWQEIKIPKIQGPFKDGSLYGHSATVWGNRIMVFGGLKGNTRKINDRVWLLDLLANVWIDISDNWNSTTDLPTHRYKHMAASDFYSHISCNTYRPFEKQHLSSLAKHQVSKYLHEHPANQDKNSDPIMLRMPADISLQKLTKTYFFGGTQNTKRSNELWELSLVFHKKPGD